MSTFKAIATLLIAIASWIRGRPIAEAAAAKTQVIAAEKKADETGDTTDLDGIS
jgi:hypothetical protein